MAAPIEPASLVKPRLSFTFELPDALAPHAVPPMLLQPLVENAIRHDLEPLRKAGTLRVSASVQGDKLRLEVSDNGVGIKPAETSSGFGVLQVRERLATLYGAQGSLVLSALATGGTLSLIELPLSP